MDGWPSVSVVVPTRDRPHLLVQALDSVRAQDYAGDLSVVVVFDGQPPDLSLETGGPVPVRVMANESTPGLPGARNTGIRAGSGDSS